MIKKISASPDGKISEISSEKILASPELVERMSKVANDVRKIAPRSDDFTYFSIVFLKSAEAALLDDFGGIKKLANGEDAWGFFDENWKWHGNVMPLKNNNGDIFPESELKKAAKDWIGKPLCRDHESSSVDGIRGIILDTHYDDKFKQVVGLCALDKVNYPDLSSKVKSGLVRYGSMGTGVEQAICTTCQKKARVQSEYCEHIKAGTNYGEVNVGLKPIEYSLVVQPAEKGAVLLKVFASLKKYQNEFINNGVSNVDEMLGKLSLNQAKHLEGIMKTACGSDGCSIDKRSNIIKSFLSNNGLVKSSQVSPDVAAAAQTARNLAESAKILDQYDDSDNEGITQTVDLAKDILGNISLAEGTTVGGEDAPALQGDNPSSFGVTSHLAEVNNDFENQDFTTGSSVPNGVAQNNNLVGFASESNKTENIRKISINKIMEDIMNESKLRSRAELRRRVAYHQGGSEGVEPNTFKPETFGFDSDKQMHQDSSMGGAEGLHPGDADLKGKLSRASNGYRGPALRTKVALHKDSLGNINKSASTFELTSGGDTLIRATAGEIFGDELDANWGWLTSPGYGKEVCKQVRASGVDHVRFLLKGAQDMGLPPLEEAPEAPAAEPAMGGDEDLLGGEGLGGEEAGAAEPADELGPPTDEEGEDSAPSEDSPSEEIDSRLADIEGLIDEIRDLKDRLHDKQVADIDVNITPGGASEELVSSETVALAGELISQIKVAEAKLNDSADEIAMVAETYDNISRLSHDQASSFTKLATAAVKDSDEIYGEATALVRVASSLLSIASEGPLNEVHDVNFIEDCGSYAADGSCADDPDHAESGDCADDPNCVDDESHAMDLVASAMNLRKERRGAILKSANDKFLGDRRSRREKMLKLAESKDDNLEQGFRPLMDTTKVASNQASSGPANILKSKIEDSMNQKKAEEAKGKYKIMLRRAYDIGLEMQRKGLLPHTKTALDKQVDEIMSFDDRAFEAFKRSIDSARSVASVKVASDLGGVNVGVSSDATMKSSVDATSASSLSMMWE